MALTARRLYQYMTAARAGVAAASMRGYAARGAVHARAGAAVAAAQHQRRAATMAAAGLSLRTSNSMRVSMPLSVRARVRALSTKAFASADEEAAAEVGSLAELDELAPAAEAEADAFSAGDAESDDLFDLDAEADIDVPMEPDAFTAPPRTRASFDNGVDPCKIWVGNLPWEVDVDELRNLGEEFGEIIDVTIVRDRMTGRSRGFGFVEFSEPSEATNAINTLNGQEFAGRVLQVNAPLPRGSGPRERPERRSYNYSHRLYVGNLAWSIREEELQNLFSDHSPESAYIVRDGDRSRGFGFVSFSNENDRNSAMSALDGFEYEGRPLRVSVAYERDRRPQRPRDDFGGGGYGGGGGGGYDSFDDLDRL